MINKILTPIATLVAMLAFSASAGGASLVADTIGPHVVLSDINISAAVKEQSALAEMPAASTTIKLANVAQGLATLKDASSLAPNFYMPDYGSSLTSAIYIRGIGSRINTPAVAMYVDDIPFIDKSAFGFNFIDVESIEVLRGPQGTLYGRNAMAGLVNIRTVNPFRKQGTTVRLGYAPGSDNYSVHVSHHHHCTQRMAFSVEGFYSGARGFFDNSYLDEAADGHQTGGGRLRAIFIPQDELKFDLTMSYEHADEGGYAYTYLGTVDGTEEYEQWKGKIATNRPSGYWRSLFNAGFKVLKQTDFATICSVTGFQLLNDCMSLDQDFLPADTFELDQYQNIRTLTEELIIKNRSNAGIWRWTTGLFFHHQWLDTESYVRFNGGGISMVQQLMDNAMQSAGSPVKITLTDNSMLIPGTYDTPSTGVAVYHQSSLDVSDNLTISVGLRLDYERMRIDYSTAAAMSFSMLMNGNVSQGRLPVEYTGDTSGDFLMLFPKVSAMYKFANNNIYASASKGSRSGGYNVQMFSDIVSMSFKGQPGSMQLSDDEINNFISYKPEYCWNYEVGGHFSLADWLAADMAVFYMDTRDQQIARFSEGGLGRRMVNAGHSTSYGIELSACANWLDNRLLADVGYGYTHSTFEDYTDVVDGVAIDYSGNRVPFVPDATLNAGAHIVAVRSANGPLNELSFGLTGNLTGEIYWNEANTAYQDSYFQLGADVRAVFGKATLTLWGKNLTDSDFHTFYFENMGHGFAQQSKPLHVGVDLKVKF